MKNTDLMNVIDALHESVTTRKRELPVDNIVMPAKTYNDVNGQKLLKDLLERKDETDFDGNKVCIQNENGKNYLRYDAVVKWLNLAMRA